MKLVSSVVIKQIINVKSFQNMHVRTEGLKCYTRRTCISTEVLMIKSEKK